MEYDSLYFLSSQNDSITSLYRIKTCCFFSKPFNFDECIKHLEETERMKIIRNNDIENFKNTNSFIYYDNFTNKTPTCDVLYRKINDCYFVENGKYFEKFTKFYFTLYSAIFPNIGLKKIKLNLNELRNSSSEFNIDFQAIVATAGINSSQTNNFVHENSIEMNFEKNKNDLQIMDAINKSDDVVDYIFKNILPIKHELFIPSIKSELDLIKNRTDHKLSDFNKTLKVENTNSRNIKLNITKNFQVGEDLGLLAGYSNENHISHDVNFELYFYDLTEPIQGINFYISIDPQIKGPWPIGCTEKEVRNNINTFEKAEEIAKELISKDPKTSIIEIVENLSFPRWTYIVKRFAIGENISDIHVGNGRRYVAFDADNFRDKEHIFNRLKKEGYYKNY
jgi:hypothetical protein